MDYLLQGLYDLLTLINSSLDVWDFYYLDVSGKMEL